MTPTLERAKSPPFGWRRGAGGAPASLTGTVAMALSAVPPIAKVPLCRIVGMALRTVGFAAVPGITSKNVLRMGDRFQMQRIHTGSIAAEMVGFQTVRNWTDKPLVSPAMGEHLAPAAVAAAASHEPTITIYVTPCSPLPASVVQNANLGPEASRQTGIAKEGRGAKLELHRKTPFVAVQPEALASRLLLLYP